MCESETFHWHICAQKVIANWAEGTALTKGLGTCPVHKQCYTAGHGLQSQPEPFHDQRMLYCCLRVHTVLFIGVMQNGTCRQLMVYMNVLSSYDLSSCSHTDCETLVTSVSVFELNRSQTLTVCPCKEITRCFSFKTASTDAEVCDVKNQDVFQ